MIRGKEIVIQEGGIRLDAALLMAFPESTRSFVREAIECGNVLVDKGNGMNRGEKGMKVRTGEKVRVCELLEACDNLVEPEPSDSYVQIREEFLDDALIALNKPVGMPVQPLSCRETGTLMNVVVARHPECRTIGDAPLMAGAVHRIDADTSGLVLVARTEAAFRNLRDQFSAQSVKKTYLALVEGAVAVGGTLENDLVHDPTLPYCKMIDSTDRKVVSLGCIGFKRRKPRAMHAITRFSPVAHTTVGNEERTLLEVVIHTGVTHQIRAQLAIAGIHIVNDRLYGAFAIEGQTGHCLHALAASFRHPTSNQPMEIMATPPAWAMNLV